MPSTRQQTLNNASATEFFKSWRRRRKAGRYVTSGLADIGHQRVLEETDQFDTCQMPINAADPSYHSFIKNVLPLLLEKNMGVLAMKTLADRGFFGQNRWDARPTGVSPLIPNRISVTEPIHFVWSFPSSLSLTPPESLTHLIANIAL